MKCAALQGHDTDAVEAVAIVTFEDREFFVELVKYNSSNARAQTAINFSSSAKLGTVEFVTAF